MVIAVDAMGGDHTPEAVVDGAVQASAECGFEIQRVGKSRSDRRPTDRRARGTLSRPPEVVEMGEQPALVVHRKQDASLMVRGELIRTGQAQAPNAFGAGVRIGEE
ncbi:MAG: hypothetical protein HY320_03660 [Armatimonadetes bacterium]|nr:hypothetical protein [Armatimonadota bacterium]